jgi:hypothetical protein
MISQTCDMKEFIEAVKDKDYYEAIYLADKEATEAERLNFRPREATIAMGCPRYADRLKGFIRFMRYGVRNRLMDDQEFETLQSLREALLEEHGSAGDPENERYASN